MRQFCSPCPNFRDSPLQPRPHQEGKTHDFWSSPIFSGNAIMAFRMLETNLGSVICSPRQNRGELFRSPCTWACAYDLDCHASYVLLSVEEL
ncbi:hypothetical protein BDN67DRAFT_105342 [Paxillus ammoniavirescens]|nr:hypothetical protein BDN67DRAFT_105342 [Paxillus ammoniavirescens]